MASLDPVSVIVFPGGFNWPIWIAQDKGYFAAGGIEVALTPTPNSVFQLTGLIEGRFDIAHTAIDKVVAFFLVFLIIGAIPRRTLARFAQGERLLPAPRASAVPSTGGASLVGESDR